MTTGGGAGGTADVLWIDVLARVDKLEMSMSEAERAAQRAGERAGEAFSQGFGARATASSQQFMGILAGLGAAAGAAGVGLVKMAGDMEMSQTAFTTLLGSGQKAKAFLADLAQFAANTPFEFQGLQDSAKRLLAFGFTAQQITPMLTAVGDAVGSLGGSKEVLDGVTLALGQMQAKGKVSAEEMNQLAERGIPAWDMLAKKIGVDIPTAMKQAADGQISAAQAIPAILQGMEDKFGGGMAAQSKTLLGMWSNTMDTMQQAGIKAGQVLVDAFDLKTKLAGFNQWISELPGLLKNFDLKQWASDNSTAIAAIGGAITAMLLPALAAGASAAVAFMAPLLPFAAAGAGVVLVLKSMGVTLDDIKRGFTQAQTQAAPLMDTLRGIAGTVQSALTPVFRTVGESVRSAIGTIQNVIQSVLLPIFSAIQPHVQPIMQSLGNLMRQVAETVRDAFRALGGAVQGILIPAFQTIWPIVKPVLDTVLSGVRVALDFITGLFKTFSSLLKGDWSKAWDDLKTTVITALSGVGKVISNGWDTLTKAAANLGKNIADNFMVHIDALGARILVSISQALLKAMDAAPDVFKPAFAAAADKTSQLAYGMVQDAAQRRAMNNGTGAYGPVTGIPPINLNPIDMNNPIVAAAFGRTGNAMADSVAGWCARWVKLTLDKAEPNAKAQIDRFFGGDANDVKATALSSGKLRKDMANLEPGDVVVYDKNHVGIYIGNGIVRGNNEWGIKNGRGVVSNENINSLGSIAGYVKLSDVVKGQQLAQAAPVTQQPTTGSQLSFSQLFPGGKTATPDPTTLKDYQLTLADWNKNQARALDLAQRLKKAEDDRNYSAQITLKGEIAAWEKGNKAREQAFQLAQKIVSEQSKAVDGPITTAQIQKAQELTAALDKATKAHDPKAIDAAKTAMESWSKASEGNARALSAVQSAQSGLTKSAKDYVATQGDLAKYGDTALQLIKAQEAAQKSGNAERIRAADAALKAFTDQGKAQMAVLDIERAAYQSRKSLADKAEADAKAAAKARTAALQNVAQAVGQGDVLTAQRSLEEAKRLQSEEVNAYGLSTDQKVQIYNASTGKILAAAYALHAEEKRQADAAVNVWAKSEEAKALTSKERDAEITRRKGQNRETERQANLDSQREQAALLRQATDQQIAEGERAATAQREQAAKLLSDRYKMSADLMRYSYGQGDEGLTNALASVTGYSVEQVKSDVTAALTEAERLNSGMASAIKNAWAEELQARKDSAAEESSIGQMLSEANSRRVDEAIAEANRLLKAGDYRGALTELQRMQGELYERLADGEPVAGGIDKITGSINGLDEAVKNLTGDAKALAEWQRLNWVDDLGIPTTDGTVAAAGGHSVRPTPGSTDTVRAAGGHSLTPQVTESTEMRGALSAEAKAWREKTEAQDYADQEVRKYSESLKGLTLAQLENAKAAALAAGDQAKYDLIVKTLTNKTEAATAAGLLMHDAQVKIGEAMGVTRDANADLIDGLEKLRNVEGVNQEQLEKLIATLKQLDQQKSVINGLTDAFTGLGKVLSAVGLDGFGKISTSLGQLTSTVGTGINQFKAIGPAFKMGFGEGLSAVGGLLGTVATGINIVGQIGDAVLNLMPGFQAWRKHLLEVADAEKKVANESVGMFKNPYSAELSQDAANRTTKANAGFLQRVGWFFTGAPKTLSDAAVKLKIEAATIFQDLGTALSDSLDSNLMNAFEVGSFEGTAKAIEKSLNTVLAKMVLKAMIMASGLEKQIQDYSDARAKALQDGKIDAQEQTGLDTMWAAIIGKKDQVVSGWQQVAPTLPGYGQNAPEQPNTPAGSIAALQEEIQKLQSALNIATSQQERDRLNAEIKAKQSQLDAMNGQVGTVSTTTGSSASNTQTFRVDNISNIPASLNFDVFGTFAASVTQLATAVPNWMAQMSASGQAHLEAGGRQLAAVDRLEKLLTRTETDWGAVRS